MLGTSIDGQVNSIIIMGCFPDDLFQFINCIVNTQSDSRKINSLYENMTTALKYEVWCPIHNDVPTSYSIYSCPNAHLVCGDGKPRMKEKKCPQCRGERWGTTTPSSQSK